MTPNEYQKLALRTASDHFDLHSVAATLVSGYVDLQALSVADRIIHASLGLTSEAGEFADQLKRALFYKARLDKANLVEEVGDILWYAALALDALGVTMETAMEVNINKLKVRYPDKFSSEAAINRDLAKEREALS